jgi:alpha-N-arabinofuranosidase
MFITSSTPQFKSSKGTTEALAAWTALNGAKISVIADPTPLSTALPNSLQLSVPQHTNGQVGFTNSGYQGQ